MNPKKQLNKDLIRARLLGINVSDFRRNRRKERLHAFLQSAVFNIPISLLILASVTLIFCEFLVSPSDLRDKLITINDIITLIFVVELSIRYYAAPNKRIYFSNYWIDILSVLPILRFFRSFRILRLLRLLRLSRAILIMMRHGGWLSTKFERYLGSYGFLLIISIFMVVGGTLAMLHFEIQAAEPTISGNEFLDRIFETSFLFVSGEMVGDAPATTSGRLISILISVAGLSVFAVFVGTVSATMTNFLRNRMETKDLHVEDLQEHIIICGWDRVGARILSELEAVPEIWRKGVVVVADCDAHISKEAGIKNASRLFHVKDDYTKFETLEKVGTARARRALVLADSSNKNLSDQDRDARTVLAALTLEKINPKIFTCAELLNKQNAAHLKIAGVEEIISRADLTAGLFAATAVNDGVTAVISQILTHHEGAYLRKITVPKEYFGKTYGSLLYDFKNEFDSTIIALEIAQEKFAEPHVNPTSSTLLSDGDRVVVLITKDSLICDLES